MLQILASGLHVPWEMSFGLFYFINYAAFYRLISRRPRTFIGDVMNCALDASSNAITVGLGVAIVLASGKLKDWELTLWVGSNFATKFNRVLIL